MNGISKFNRESSSSRDDRKQSQGYVDIKKKSKEELEELMLRQNKLLQNRAFIQKLPDKGQKIILFKTQLEHELKKRQEDYDATCNLLYKLTLNDSEHMEWNNGELKNNLNYEKPIDSDDEHGDMISELNPLKLMATHSGTKLGSKVIYKNSNDLNSDEKVLYADKFCEKYGSANKTKERFKPNQLKYNEKDRFVTSAERVKQKFGEKWEVTQATPPVPVFKDTILISLSESLKLQKQQAERVKEMEKKYTTERLLQCIGIKMGDKLPVINVKEYRTNSGNIDETKEDDEEGCSDSENEDEEENFVCPGKNEDC